MIWDEDRRSLLADRFGVTIPRIIHVGIGRGDPEHRALRSSFLSRTIQVLGRSEFPGGPASDAAQIPGEPPVCGGSPTALLQTAWADRLVVKL